MGAWPDTPAKSSTIFLNNLKDVKKQIRQNPRREQNFDMAAIVKQVLSHPLLLINVNLGRR